MKPVVSAIALLMFLATSQMSSAKSNIFPSGLPGVPGEITVTNVNIKAVRDFARLYRNINNAKWYTTGKGYSASFDMDGKNIKVVYDINGMRQYTIISYTEKYLDFGIRDLVKRNFYDHNIIGVHQFEFENNKTVYVIKMIDAQSNAMTVKVYDGQIGVIN